MTMPNNCSRRNFVNSTLAPSTLRFGLIGDYDAAITAHTAIPVALRLAGDALSQPVEPFWIHTSELNSEESIRSLRQFQGIWCVPASPYANTEGALSAIRLARLAHYREPNSFPSVLLTFRSDIFHSSDPPLVKGAALWSRP